MRRRDVLKLAAGAAAVPFAAGSARAQAWPDRPVKFIVSFAAGGATDLVARPWADVLTKEFNQQFVVENRGGASGLIGTEAAFKSAPDGYTFLFTGNTNTVLLPQLRPHPFDVRKFVAVARTGDALNGFVIHPSVGVKTFKEMIDYAKKNPGKLNFGSSGPGTAPHLRLEMLKFRTGVDIAHIPYRGGADSLQDLLAGNIQMMNEGATLPHVKAGKLILLNINFPTRVPEFPDAPSLTELGYPNSDVATWFALYGPPGLPSEIADKLHAKINEISATAEMRAKMSLVSSVAVTQSRADLQKFWDAEWVQSEQLIKAAGIKLE
jgi:tripartite-type tricarboxylate transporter receptor subunit TctC